MQSRMSEQSKKAEELISAIANMASVHCRRDTLWQRLQSSTPASALSHAEFGELLSLSYAEPVSSCEPQLVPLLAQPVGWYQGLAKLLLARYPDTQRHFLAPADGHHTAQHVVILNQRLPATAMMLSWDTHADKAVSAASFFFLFFSSLSLSLFPSSRSSSPTETNLERDLFPSTEFFQRSTRAGLTCFCIFSSSNRN